jgi:hypothetical protein
MEWRRCDPGAANNRGANLQRPVAWHACYLACVWLGSGSHKPALRPQLLSGSLLSAGTAGDPPPTARIGHVAVAIDATATWGTELLVVHGGIGEDKHALRCAQAAG